LNGQNASAMWFEAHEQIGQKLFLARNEIREEYDKAKLELHDLLRQRNEAVERLSVERDDFSQRLDDITRQYAKDEKELKNLQKILDSTEKELYYYKEQVSVAQNEINRLKLQLDPSDMQIEQPVDSRITPTPTPPSGFKRTRDGGSPENQNTKRRRIQVIRPTKQSPKQTDGEKL